MDVVFGYGSLVAMPDARPARLRDHERFWGVSMDNALREAGYKRYRTPAGDYPRVCVAFLDVEPVPGRSVDGACVPVDADRLAEFDHRERNYARTEVTALVDGAGAGVRVWTYVGLAVSRERTTRARRHGRLVVADAYLAVVEQAFDAIGPDALARYHATTRPPACPVAELLREDLLLPRDLAATRDRGHYRAEPGMMRAER